MSEVQATAAQSQQAALRALAEAQKQVEHALQELEHIHPVAVNSTEYKEVKLIGAKLRDAMLSVMKMRVA